MAVDRRKQEKVYVKVCTDFDSTGYMQPRSVTWSDGRTFKIEKVKDFRPAKIYLLAQRAFEGTYDDEPIQAASDDGM